MANPTKRFSTPLELTGIIYGYTFFVAFKNVPPNVPQPTTNPTTKNKKPSQTIRLQGFNIPLVWCRRESNPRHKDFQSFALPTELLHHFCGSAKVVFLAFYTSYFPNIFKIYTICLLNQFIFRN